MASERAVEPLFRMLWAPLVRYATRFLGDAALAEDCVQDAMTTLFGQLDRSTASATRWPGRSPT